MYTILIIEDDRDMAEAMQRFLEKWGYQTTIICEAFDRIWETFRTSEPHIVLLDINIPVYDGFYLCRKIRDISNVPIVFVSSRDSNMDIVMAMNSGGDDYIQKPFDSQVLVAKLQAIIRRTYEYRTDEPHLLQCGSIMLNLKDGKLYSGEQVLDLTKNEFRILQVLIERRGNIVTRDALMKRLWNDDLYVNENTLTVNINRLRKKLEEIEVCDLIDTKKGLGYLIP